MQPTAEFPSLAFSMAELLAKLEAVTPPGTKPTVTWSERADGSSQAAYHLGDRVLATWTARLVNEVPRDGVTPRGPREYLNLKLYA